MLKKNNRNMIPSPDQTVELDTVEIFSEKLKRTS